MPQDWTLWYSAHHGSPLMVWPHIHCPIHSPLCHILSPTTKIWSHPVQKQVRNPTSIIFLSNKSWSIISTVLLKSKNTTKEKCPKSNLGTISVVRFAVVVDFLFTKPCLFLEITSSKKNLRRNSCTSTFEKKNIYNRYVDGSLRITVFHLLRIVKYDRVLVNGQYHLNYNTE